MKRILIIAVVLNLVFSAFSVTAFAEETNNQATEESKIFTSEILGSASAPPPIDYSATVKLNNVNTQLLDPTLPEVKQLLCYVLYNGIIQMDNEIEFDGFCIPYDDFSLEMVQNCIDYIFSSVHHLFMSYVNLTAYGYYDDLGNAYMTSIGITYQMTPEEYYPKLQIYTDCLYDIINEIPKNSTDLGKMLYVYDYLALNYAYDYANMGRDEYQTEAAYTFLYEKTGVCKGYAEVFSAVMLELGIPCTEARFIKQETDNQYNENHIWNIVELDGKTYHIDATWADGTPNPNISSDVYGYLNHSFFLLSDSALNARDSSGNHSHYYTNEALLLTDEIMADRYSFEYYETLDNLEDDITCTSNDYLTGYAWNETISQFAFYNGEYYYITPGVRNGDITTAIICKTTDFINSVPITTISSPSWKLLIKDTNQTVNVTEFNFSLSAIDSQLYYNTANGIKYYDIKTGTTGNVMTLPSNTDKEVFFMLYSKNGGFRYSLNRYEEYGTNRYTILSDFVNAEYNIDTAYSGDITGDGNVNSADLIAISNYLLSGDSTGLVMYRADLSGERNITVRDLIRLKKLCSENV